MPRQCLRCSRQLQVANYRERERERERELQEAVAGRQLVRESARARADAAAVSALQQAVAGLYADA
jgi:hypothetical protein